jgi:CheY-like chemotaxis protein
MPKIFQVEDNDDDVYVMRGRLVRLRFEIVVAADGEQGVAGAQKP